MVISESNPSLPNNPTMSTNPLLRFADTLQIHLEGWIRKHPESRIREIRVTQISNKRSRISLTLAVTRESMVAVLISFDGENVDEYVAGPIGQMLKQPILSTYIDHLDNNNFR